jgi:hypothetical protein
MDQHALCPLASGRVITQFKVSRRLMSEVRADLSRPHPFAAERVGFLSARVSLARDTIVILATRFMSVDDDDYLDEQSVGAMIGPEAIRKALQFSLKERVSMFHVHAHLGLGIPRFSRIDLRLNKALIPNFFQVSAQTPHGAVVLSDAAMAGSVQFASGTAIKPIEEFVEVGLPIRKWGLR